MEVFHAGRIVGMHVDTHLEDGWIVLGDVPRLGITFDEATLDRLAIPETPETVTALPAGQRGAGLYEIEPDEPADGLT